MNVHSEWLFLIAKFFEFYFVKSGVTWACLKCVIRLKGYTIFTLSFESRLHFFLRYVSFIKIHIKVMKLKSIWKWVINFMVTLLYSYQLKVVFYYFSWDLGAISFLTRKIVIKIKKGSPWWHSIFVKAWNRLVTIFLIILPSLFWFFSSIHQRHLSENKIKLSD